MSLTGKVAIVTGGNGGIGRKSAFFASQIVARQMIKQGGGLMQGSPGL